MAATDLEMVREGVGDEDVHKQQPERLKPSADPLQQHLCASKTQ